MKTLPKQQTEKYISLLKQGNERGLDYFYRRFYNYLFHRALRATQEECTAESIAQEALLRLWLYREQITHIDDIFNFLKRQTRSAIDAFYNKSRNRFNRSLLRLDGIEDYQEFLLGYEMEETDPTVKLYHSQKTICGGTYQNPLYTANSITNTEIYGERDNYFDPENPALSGLR